MAILAECPTCKKRQSNRNRQCSCGEDLAKAKRSGRVKYWITYRVQGKQRKETVGYSLDEARNAESKRKVQKREGKFFEMLPENKLTFLEVTDWYLNLPHVQDLRSYSTLKSYFNIFNETFGKVLIKDVTPNLLAEYQAKRKKAGIAPRTIDYAFSLVKTALTRAADEDLIDGGRVLKAFRRAPRMLRKGANARRRVMSPEEYLRLLGVAPLHLRAALVVAFNTGMRAGEIRALQWAHIDRKKDVIRLPGSLTKEAKEKVIPINHHVKATIDEIPHALHHDFVITYQGEPMTAKEGFKRSFNTACTKAKVPFGRDTVDGMIFHDLRRSVKTYMVQAGVDKALRDIILGHSLEGMDAHYLAPTEEHLKAAMDKYTAWLDVQLEESKAKLEMDALNG